MNRENFWKKIFLEQIFFVKKKKPVKLKIGIIYFNGALINWMAMFVYHLNLPAFFAQNRNRRTLLFVIITAFPVLFAISLPISEKSYAIYHQ